MRIHHSKLIGHVDLDHIQMISDAVFYDHMGYGGWYVGFRVYLMFRDQPIEYTRPLDGTEWLYESFGSVAKTVSDQWTNIINSETIPTLLCIHNMQRDIDELVSAWRGES